VDVRFSGQLNSEKAKNYFSDVKIEGASLSGVLSCDPRDFLSWINTSVTVESFQIQVPSLEQIFIEEVKKHHDPNLENLSMGIYESRKVETHIDYDNFTSILYGWNEVYAIYSHGS